MAVFNSYVSLPEGTHGLENDSTCSHMRFQQSPSPKVPTSSLPAEGLHKPWHRSDARGAPFPALNGIPFGNLTYEKWGFSWIFHICVGLPEGTQEDSCFFTNCCSRYGDLLVALPWAKCNSILPIWNISIIWYDPKYMASSSIGTMVSWGSATASKGRQVLVLPTGSISWHTLVLKWAV